MVQHRVPYSSAALKICDVTQFYSPVSGGVKRYISEKVRYMTAHRPDDEHILIVPGAGDAVEVAARSKTYSIRSPSISKVSQYRALLRLGQVERILDLERPDLIECGDPYQVAWRVVHAGGELRIPVVGFYHSHFPDANLRLMERLEGPLSRAVLLDLGRRYVRSLYNRFTRTIVPSPALGCLLEEWGVGNVFETDLGVDTSTFRPVTGDRHALRDTLGLPGQGTLLLYVGRLAPEKNTATLFEAFQQISRESAPEFHLLVVGDGDDRGPLENLASALGGTLASQVDEGHRGRLRLLAPGLSWLPYCEDATRLAQLFGAADVFVHPGVLETFGLVSLEAQACGTPVVGIRGSYMDRIIRTDQSCWAMENTSGALAAAIRRAALLAGHEDRAALGRQIAAHYGWEQVFTRLFDLYGEVVESHAASKYE